MVVNETTDLPKGPFDNATKGRSKKVKKENLGKLMGEGGGSSKTWIF